MTPPLCSFAICGKIKDNLKESMLSPSTMWVAGIKLRSSALASIKTMQSLHQLETKLGLGWDAVCRRKPLETTSLLPH